jgi:transcriptional regulator with XRE-family HTH domain
MDERYKIEKIMQTENMNSAQFAVEIGIQGSTLSHILNGRNKPSLDVLKKILNRFRTINPEWLILDVGTMYRQEKHSQTPTLFDSEPENSKKSESYSASVTPKNDTPKESNQQDNVNFQNQQLFNSTPNPVQTLSPLQTAVKTVKKIIVYYSDNTFQEFDPIS